MKKILIIGGVVVLIAAVVGGYMVTRPKKATVNSTSASTSSQTASTTKTTATQSTTKDACTILTAAKVTELLGLSVNAGTSEPSNIGGSTCKFNNTSPYTTVTLQVGDKKYANSKSSFNGKIVDVPGVGDEAFYQVPVSGATGDTLDKGGTSNAVVKKGNNYALITIYSMGSYNSAQVAALLNYVAGQL